MRSIKLFTLSLLAFLLSTVSFAEGDAKLLGIRAGWQISDAYNDGKNLGAYNSFYMGVFKDNNILPILDWTVGLEYFRNGWYQSDAFKQILSAISVPVNLKVKLGPFFALGGIAVNFKINEKQAGIVIQEAAKFDLPLVAGIGAKFSVIIIEARYHWGTQKLNDGGYKHQYLQVGAGVSF